MYLIDLLPAIVSKCNSVTEQIDVFIISVVRKCYSYGIHVQINRPYICCVLIYELHCLFYHAAAMQARYCDEHHLSVHPSVCHTRELLQNEST